MRFAKYGNTYQLRIENRGDLHAVLELDDALWMASAAPVDAFACDQRFLSFLSVGDSRIRSDEVREAVRWVLDVFADCDGLFTGLNELQAKWISRDSDDGAAIIRTLDHIEREHSVTAAGGVTLEVVRRLQEDAALHRFNGDGIVAPADCEDGGIRELVSDIVRCLGGVKDMNGRDGVTAEHVDRFMHQVSERRRWQEEQVERRQELLPFGSETASLFAVLTKVAAKIDEYFALVETAEFNEAAQAESVRLLEDRVRQAARRPFEKDNILSEAPLARVAESRELPLSGRSVNPSFRERLNDFQQRVAAHVLGHTPEALTREQWVEVQKRFQLYAEYAAREPGRDVAVLGEDRLKRYADTDLCERLRAAIARDTAAVSLGRNLLLVEKTILFQRYFVRFLNNFVSFPQMYDPADNALFERGSLVIDGRWFNFAVQVHDPATHSAIAKSGRLFVMYAEVTEASSSRVYHLAVPATSGTKGSLFVGKRGVFFDVAGNEHDARIVQVIENPISTYEAMTAPFVRLWEFIIGKIESFSGASERELQAELQKNLQDLKKPVRRRRTPLPTTWASGGMLVGLSVSLAAVSSAFAFVTKTFSALTGTQVLQGVAAVVLLVLTPVFLLASLKLRQQNLGILLEASGWAVNQHLRPNRVQRRQFTQRPSYPAGAAGTPRRRRAAILALILLTLAAAATVVYLFSSQIVRAWNTLMMH